MIGTFIEHHEDASIQKKSMLISNFTLLLIVHMEEKIFETIQMNHSDFEEIRDYTLLLSPFSLSLSNFSSSYREVRIASEKQSGYG